MIWDISKMAMCCAPIPARPHETVGDCPSCGMPVDIDGDSTDEGCEYSDDDCDVCHRRPCDLAC